MNAEVQWIDDADSVACRSSEGLVFRDTREHWSEAVCRLLNFTDEAARSWVEMAAEEGCASSGGAFCARHSELRAEALARASTRFFRIPPVPESRALPCACAVEVMGAPADWLWIHGMREDHGMAVIGSRHLQHGVLVRFDDGICIPATPPSYEESYFEGAQPGVGYGRCRDQAVWRMEKAGRLVRQVQGIGQYAGKSLPAGTRLLDLGSGYGYFRKASEDCGWHSDGVEISRHAAAVACQEFGLDTFVGSLEEFSVRSGQPYDVVTLFDVIEHVRDPVALLRTIRELLAPGGLCVVRTPNLLALEADIFRSHYHSVKAEHLQYFSPNSLCFAMESAGLTPVFLTSESHLLRGFFGEDLHRIARLLKGSDLMAVARRAS